MKVLFITLLCFVAVNCIPDFCRLPEDRGPGKALLIRWRFDVTASNCIPFFFGGMGGNKNNFRNYEDCQKACLPKPPTLELAYASAQDICTLPKAPGPCFGFMPRYYYDADKQKCIRFIYGGCQGNENNFADQVTCMNFCRGIRRMPGHRPSICLEEAKVVGPCRARIPRYSYNKATGKCELFYYGGCRGTKNRFTSLDECNRICQAN